MNRQIKTLITKTNQRTSLCFNEYEAVRKEIIHQSQMDGNGFILVDCQHGISFINIQHIIEIRDAQEVNTKETKIG